MKETQRVIKFRAWDGHKMITPSVIGKHGEWYATGIDFEDRRSDKEGLMQFTGLQDSKGVDIYESDIVKITDKYNENSTVVVVKYINAGFTVEWSNAFSGGESDITTVGWALDEGNEIEVIGHIYDPKFSHLL